MSREIIFKAKAIASMEELDDRGIKHENGWVQGDLVDGTYIVNGVLEVNDEHIIIAMWCPIDPKTVSQYTTLPDQNGKRIWDGDIVRIDNLEVFNLTSNYNDTPVTGSCISEVEIIEGKTYVWLMPVINGRIIRYGARVLLKGASKYIRQSGVATGSVEVIGNIHDNPELLSRGVAE
ncbi:hypothetical protein HCB27_16760 [Listeria booriae]|uniref:YopX protein domain-containing protein n=1 Tax=Listeria booriae TaxID=1552123 RepID=A0A7X0Z960_9LIST|nr:YopX family protein [Listeria booriae]MBC2178191.1 hypothetical protein [Listeria booriae]MBC2178282.1 hypothetical protein [Listeria booriae]